MWAQTCAEIKIAGAARRLIQGAKRDKMESVINHILEKGVEKWTWYDPDLKFTIDSFWLDLKQTDG